MGSRILSDRYDVVRLLSGCMVGVSTMIKMDLCLTPKWVSGNRWLGVLSLYSLGCLLLAVAPR